MTEKTYLTVTALNKYIERKFLLDPYLGEIYIKGEISNYKIHNNNNIYFSIKDENTRINAVWFRAEKLDFKDGDTVLIRAKINYYFPRGEHNLLVQEMKKDRIGELYQKFLELKEKLEKEGLFDPIYKKKINPINNTIAVVTAETGAAIQDIKRTILRRFPLAHINVYSTLVQGDSAAGDIINKLKLADNDNNDVIILARGGGSIEDLWSFNTEEVVRAIFNCITPIVTGIGHETDTTLSDYVSDIRASTPTAAAEIVTPNIEDIKNKLDFSKKALDNRIKYIIDTKKNQIKKNEDNPYIKNHIQIYKNYRKTIEILQKDLEKSLNSIIKDKKLSFSNNMEKFSNIDVLKKYKEDLIKKIEHLETNSPTNILKKGYSISFKNNNKVTSISEIEKNDELTVQLIDGKLNCIVEKIVKEGVQ